MMGNQRKTKDALLNYGKDYQQDMAEKFRNRNSNHWKLRIELARNLVEKYVLSKYPGRPKKDIVVVDVGCSIGTFAIEFSKQGYRSYGIDFDSAALDIAKQLSDEENVTPGFICGDVSKLDKNFPPIDIAICFDIFEHLHDDELGSLLSSIRSQFSDKGALVFHTYPTQYDYIFYYKRYLSYPVLLFKNLSKSGFNKIVKAYSCLIDVLLLLKTGKTYKEMIRCDSHCNPTTSERLVEILKRSGYEVVFMESSNLYDNQSFIQKCLCKQPIAFRNLYGVAIPKPKI